MRKKRRFTPVLLIILCVLPYVISQGDRIRLSGSDEPLQGRVEIQHDDAWGTICFHDGWDLTEAHVICRQLGLPQALFTSSVSDGSILPGSGSNILLSDVECTGDESSITECLPIGYTIGTVNPRCDYNDDVIVTCALPGFIGCYRDVPDRWKLSTSNPYNSRLTTDSCLYTCRYKGYPYAALSQGEFCWCGNDTTIGGERLSPSECNAPCDGNEEQFCGGMDGITSFYSANLDGALADPYQANRVEGRIASPSFPGPYSATMEWKLQFLDWVILAIRIPFFDLNEQDLLNFSGYNGDFRRLTKSSGAPEYFEMGPLRHLDLTLAVNVNYERTALGFLLIYEVLPTSPPMTRPPPTVRPTTRPPATRPPPTTPPPTTPSPETSRPPPPPPPPTTPPPLPTTPTPMVTTEAPTTEIVTTPQPTTQPVITTEKSTTERMVPTTAPMTTKRSTTKRATEPPPPEESTTVPVQTTSMMSTTDDGVRGPPGFFLTAWLEFWTFVCVSLFVVGMVLICLICWKSGKWRWLKRGKRYRHRVIHRHHSNHSSWSDHYNYSFNSDLTDHPHHKHHQHHNKHHLYNGSESGSDSSLSSIHKHRRHRRHSSHSSYSSTCTPPSVHRSLSSKSSSSSSSSDSKSHSKSSRSSAHSRSSHSSGSRQHLIYPPNHEAQRYPGIIYDSGHPGQPPRAYPMYPPQYQDPTPLSSDYPPPPPAPPTGQEYIPAQQTSPFISDLPEPYQAEDGFTVPRVIDGDPGFDDRRSSTKSSLKQQRKLSQKRGSTDSNKSSGRKGSFKGFGFRRSSSKNKETEQDRTEDIIEERPPQGDVFSEDDLDEIYTQEPAQPVYIAEDECGPRDDDYLQFDPASSAYPRQTYSTDNDLIVPEVEPFIVSGNSGIPQPPPPPPLPPHVSPSSLGEEYCPPPPDGYRPVPQPPASMGDGTIIPEVEPYIMSKDSRSNSRNGIKSSAKHRKSSTPSIDSNKSGKSGKRFGIFGKSKNKKSSKHPEARVISEEPDGGGAINEEGALGEREIEDVLSGLEDTIQQAENQYSGANSVSGYSDVNGRASSTGLDNPLYRGSSSFAGSDLGSPTPPAGADDVFAAVGSHDDKPDELIPESGDAPAHDFILPGDGDDSLLDDLDMFGGGEEGIPPPPNNAPPAPPHVATDEFWTPLN